MGDDNIKKSGIMSSINFDDDDPFSKTSELNLADLDDFEEIEIDQPKKNIMENRLNKEIPKTNMNMNITEKKINQTVLSDKKNQVPLNPDDIPTGIIKPETLEDLNIPKDLVVDGVVRHLYFSGNLTGLDLSKRLKVPFNGIVEQIVDQLLKQKYVSYEGGRGFGRSSMTFQLTDQGRDFAKESLNKNSYMGPIPVCLDDYKRNFKDLKESKKVSTSDIKEWLSSLILPPNFVNSIGPAINSNHSIFLYGPPGNGKTVIADKIGQNLRGDVTIPYAVEVDGQIIKVFDGIFHDVIEENPLDNRWVKIKRPYVFVGGELTYNMLNLNLDPVSKIYEAPLQLKANGGIFLIDDFGRQKEPPKMFLNRWIVPLENGFDVLNFSSGKSFSVPFEQLIIFSTNLDPKELVDEAFLRRIRYKIGIENPGPEIFLKIFELTCKHYKIEYVLSEVENFFFYNRETKPKIRAVLPRDLARIIKSICDFEGMPYIVNFYTLKKASEIGFISDINYPD